MLTKEKILAFAEEFDREEEKTQRVPHYYKRNGKILERSYPDYIYTDRYKFLFHSDESPLNQPFFLCSGCGKKVSYWRLERWCCDFNKDRYVCSYCYEEEMGEDL